MADHPSTVQEPCRSSSADIFTTARDKFLLSLSPAEQSRLSECTSIADVLDGVKDLEHLGKVKKRVLPCLTKVKLLGDNLGPYFKIIEIFCGAHPEWANIAFGALRLILQLASHFVTFFEKVCDAVEKLGARLLRYQNIFDTLAANPSVVSPELRDSLARVYCHLFEFFTAIARVFSNQQGRIRRTPVVIASLMWKPFDVRFQNVLDAIKFHQEIVKEELQFASAGQLRSILRRDAQKARQERQDLALDVELLNANLETQRREAFTLHLTTWLDPPPYKEYLEQAQQDRTQGTTEWVLEDGRFTAWRNVSPRQELESSSRSPANFESSTLWLHGKPGCGKTVIAGSIIDDLSGFSEQDPEFPPEVCYYFFNETSSDSKTNRSDAYRALAAQLFDKFHGLEKIYNIFNLAADAAKTGLTRASEGELVETISQCLPCLPNLYFVFDGLDECSDVDKLLNQINTWCSNTPLRVLLLSRPEVSGLYRSVPKDNQIPLTQASLDGDISVYLRSEVEDLAQHEMLPLQSDTKEMVDHLVSRAEGMFLWARLMVTYLSSPAMTKSQRHEVIMESETGALDSLDRMYCRIQSRIESLDNRSRNLARKALIWAAYAALESRELLEAIRPDGWDRGDENGTTDDFDHTVTLVCCGLIEKRCNGTFHYIHLTAWRFARLGNKWLRALPLVPSESDCKTQLAVRCLGVLQKLPQKPLSGELGRSANPFILAGQWPLLQFAAEHWVTLTLGAIKTNEMTNPTVGTEIDEIIESARGFLHMKLTLMVWVEALYSFKLPFVQKSFHHAGTTVVDLLREPYRQAILEILAEIKDLLLDLGSLHENWGSTLSNNPAEIWGDVTAFTKSRFFVLTRAIQMETLPPRSPRRLHHAAEEEREAPFSCSMPSPDGRRLAILSIYPSENFRRGWENSIDIPCSEKAFHMAKSVDASQPPEWKPFSERGVCTIPDNIGDACSGWQAIYETILIDDTHSRNISRVSIPLDPGDVELCLRQSLRFSPLGHWRCSFQLTISPDLTQLSILNRVVYVAPHGDRYHMTRLPLHVHHKEAWSSPSESVITYKYEFFWSATSRYLAYLGDDSRTASLAIFDITDEAKGPVLVNHTSSITSSLLTNCSFHPTSPLFMYKMQAGVFLWKFLDGSAVPTQVYALPALRGYGPEPDDLDYKVSFSHCGTSLAISMPRRPWPMLLPLPREYDCNSSGKRKLAVADLDDNTNPQDTERIKIITTARNDDGSVDVHSILDKLPPVLSSWAVPLGNRTSSTRDDVALLNLRTSPGKVAISYRDGSRLAQVPVVNLPSCIPTSSVSATLTLPTGFPHDHAATPPMCKVILVQNAARVQESDVSATSTHLPLVLRKDTRALRHEDGSGSQEPGSINPSSRPYLVPGIDIGYLPQI